MCEVGKSAFEENIKVPEQYKEGYVDPALVRYVPRYVLAHTDALYRDGDGIWLEGDRYLWNGLYEYHGIHCWTVAEFRREVRSLEILADGDPNCTD